MVTEARGQPKDVVLILQTQPYFDTQGGFHGRDNLVEYRAYLFGIGEDSTAAVFGGDGTHGTSHIPVYLIVSQVVESVT